MFLVFQPWLFRVLLACTFAGYALCFSTFQWPNPLLSWADKQLYEGPLDALVRSCAARDNTTVSAQWLRIAYHDMATHNGDDGTGGLDASIQFELDRPQNVGQGMVKSLSDFKIAGITTPFFGLADVIALGVVLGVAECGGPLIPFSAGRIDATSPGPETVPEPQQDLLSHIESFRRQGFSQSEMIALVACGHTLGGVTKVDFPEVVQETSEDVSAFDTTKVFDDQVVSEYLRNTTENVLVVGPNATTSSDFRIFSSDGNVTMQSLLSPGTFNDTCGVLLERVINTVPSDVKLTEPIPEPFDYVVSDPLLSHGNGTFKMKTTLRVLRQRSNRTVTLLWAEREGTSCPSTGCFVQSSNSTLVPFTTIGTIQGLNAQRYSFEATTNSSISKFWFEIDEHNGSGAVIVNNGGSGFVIEQDNLFVDYTRSAFVSGTVGSFFKVVVAVRGDAASTSGSISAFNPISSSPAPPFLPIITSSSLQLDNSNPAEGGFSFLTANVSLDVTSVDISASVAGNTYTKEHFDMTVGLNFRHVSS